MHMQISTWLHRAIVLIALVSLTACATGPNADPRDPLEPMNRGISTVNYVVDKAVLSPIARGYRTIAPSPVRTAVSNFFNNIAEVWSIPNSLLQGKVKDAIESTMRISFNTVFGFAGLLDIASEMRMQRHEEDFGQTLGYWGMPQGPYLVWPLLGPSTLRDSVGRVASMAAGVQKEVVETAVAADRVNKINNSLTTGNLISGRAEILPITDLAEKVALDLYSFTKDAYLQSRLSAVHDGNPPPTSKLDPSLDNESRNTPQAAQTSTEAHLQPQIPTQDAGAKQEQEEEDWTRGMEPDAQATPPASFVPDPVASDTVIPVKP